MKKPILCLCLLLALCHILNAESTKPDADKSVTITINDQQLQSLSNQPLPQIEKRLEIIEQKYLVKLNKTDQKQAQQLLKEIRGLLALLPNYSQGTNININLGSQEQPVQLISAMDDKTFGELKKSIIAAMYGDTGIKVLKTAAKDNYFSTSQILSVLQLFSFSDDKTEALAVMYPRCVDPENKFKIMNAFLFDSDKQKAADILEME